MLHHLGLNFRDRFNTSVEMAARAGTGVRDVPVYSEVPVEVNSRANEAEMTA